MKRNDLNEKIFDEMLKYITEERMEEMGRALPSDNETIPSYTPDFEKKMTRFFSKLKRSDRSRRRRRTLIKAATAVAAFILVFSAVVFSVEALRAPFLNIFMEPHEEYTDFYIAEDNADYEALGQQARGIYLPMYVPEGFKVESINGKNDGKYTIVYKNSEDEMIQFGKRTASSIGMDTEDADVREITINEELATMIVKGEIVSIIFRYQDDVFVISGYMSMNEAIMMAESVKFRK